MPSNSLWLARDMGGSGLYTVWLNAEPEINSDGYYKYTASGDHVSLLLVTIHPSKLPWEDLALDHGDCIELTLERVGTSIAPPPGVRELDNDGNTIYDGI